MKNVLLKIKGTQTVGDNEPEVIEVFTEGTMDINERRTLLIYDEGEELGGGKTEFRIAGEKTATLKRSGDMSSRIVIQNGRRHLCHYVIPQGEMMVGVFGENIKNSLTENGGEVALSYTIDINMGLLSRNQVEISVEVVE